MNRKSLVGERFGKLVVTEMIYGQERYGRKRTQCRCICDCGNEVDMVADALRSGKRVSCGCDAAKRRTESQRKDLTGMRFGRLVVLSMDWSTHPSRARCVCDCGNEITVIGTGLTSGKTQSCGCLQRERASLAVTKDWSGTVSPYGICLLRQSKQSTRGKWLWRCKCGLCGSEFDALPAKVMSGHTTSCGCRRQSAREQLIDNTLQELGVEYAREYTIPECKSRYVLRFDFAVFDNGELTLLIEYDGEQHFIPIDIWGGTEAYLANVERDKLKDTYCMNNQIRLLRLPYTLTDEEIRQKIEDIIYP